MKKIVNRLLIVIFASILALNTFGVYAVSASIKKPDGPADTLPSDYEQKAVTLIEESSLPPHSEYDYDDPQNTVAGSATDSTYTAKYNVDYYGRTLTAEVSARIVSQGDGATTKVYTNRNNLLEVGWLNAGNAQVSWSIKLYDGNNNSFLKYFLIGFYDPDESNYVFDTTGRNIYYIDAESKNTVTALSAANFYNFTTGTSGGFSRSNNSLEGVNFNGAVFAVSVPSTETEFRFTTTTPYEGAIAIPYLYTKNYPIEYNFNDSEGPAATPDATKPANPSSYASSPYVVTIENNPSRVGYKFLGWNNESDYEYTGDTIPDPFHNTIEADKYGKKIFKAYWEPLKYKVLFDPNTEAASDTAELVPGTDTQDMTDLLFNGQYNLTKNGYQITGYKFMGWSLTSGEQPVVMSDEEGFKNLVNYLESGDVDLEHPVTLYAQWDPIVYTVKYDPNEPDPDLTAEGTMGDQTPLNYDEDYNLTPNAYSLTGYDFLGWSLDSGKHDVQYSDKQGFINLVAEDGGVITMHAQWDPWKYTIKYDANGGKGEMGDNNFVFTDSKMESDLNRFTRDGYDFKGFLYTAPDGTQTLYKDINDFRQVFMKLGRNSTIVLVAQWAKKREKTVYYEIPTTGINQ